METVEQEARSMGWVPLEEFRSGPDKWVDAETFVERGRNIMPILRKNNERLESTVKQQQTELQRMKQLMEAGQEAIQELQKVHSDATKAAVEKARREMLAELKQAKMDGDVDREIALQDGLQELKAAQAAAEKKPVIPAPATSNDALHPDFKEWMAENTWFGNDNRKTLRAMGIAQEMRADPEYDKLEGRAFFDKVLEIMDERTGAPPTNKVAEGRSSGSPTSGGGGKGFSDLPAEAKDACDRQGRKLVGEGRAFKDQAAWRKYYAELYFN